VQLVEAAFLGGGGGIAFVKQRKAYFNFIKKHHTSSSMSVKCSFTTEVPALNFSAH